MPKGKRVSAEEIVSKLRLAEIELAKGQPIEEVCKKIQISPQSFYRWRKEYGGLEIDITGSEGDLTDDELFVITVTNSDRAPVLAAIGDETVNEGVAITAINANDGGDDFDADNDAITYTCFYDTTIDGSVAETTACTALTGVSFTAGTGAMTWTPNSSQAGSYEFVIKGSEGDLDDTEIFAITVQEVILTITPDPKTGMDIVSSTVAGANVTFTVTNLGNGTSASLNAPSLGGANAANFEITTNNCTGALGPSATCTIEVRPLGSTDGTFCTFAKALKKVLLIGRSITVSFQRIVHRG